MKIPYDKNMRKVELLLTIVLIISLSYCFKYLADTSAQNVQDQMVSAQYVSMDGLTLGEYTQSSSCPAESAPPTEDDSNEDGAARRPEQAITVSEAAGLLDTLPLLNVDHTGLSAQNPDYACWIQIPGSRISYPVLYPSDNTHYLKQNFKGQKSASGAIFIDSTTQRDWGSSKNLIIHGHNMKSGSMFAGLLSYRNVSYYNSHPFVFLYAPGTLRVYQVYAAYSVRGEMDDNALYPLGFNTEEDFQGFISMAQSRTPYDTGINPPYTGRCLTLSTCTNHSQDRFIVNAVLVREIAMES